MSLRSSRSHLGRLAAKVPRCNAPLQFRFYHKGEPKYQLTEADRCSCGILGHNIVIICEITVVGRNEAGELIDEQGDVVG